MMIGNNLLFVVLFSIVCLAASKSNPSALSKKSVTSFQTNRSNPQENNRHIALRLLSQFLTRPARYYTKKKAQSQPDYDYEGYYRDEGNKHFCLRKKCYFYSADKGKIYEMQPETGAENVNVLINYLGEYRNDVKKDNMDDGYERDDEDEAPEKEKDSSKYFYVDDMKKKSNQLRNKDIQEPTSLSRDYIGDLFKDEIGRVFTKDNINVQRLLTEDRGDVNKNINDWYKTDDEDNKSIKNNNEIENKGSVFHDLSKTSNYLRNGGVKTPFSEDYVGDLFGVMRATGKDEIGKKISKKNINEQHQAKNYKYLKSRKLGVKVSAAKKKRNTTIARSIDNSDDDGKDKVPADATDDSNSNESGVKIPDKSKSSKTTFKKPDKFKPKKTESKKADESISYKSRLSKEDKSEPNESVLRKKKDESESNESGLKKADAYESDESGSKKADAYESNESESKKADVSDSNEFGFKKPDVSKSNESGPKEKKENKWNRFKVVKPKGHKPKAKKPMAKMAKAKKAISVVAPNSASLEKQRFEKASTETLEALSEEPKPKPVIKKKRRPRIPGKPEHYMQGPSRYVTEGEDFRKNKDNVTATIGTLSRKRLPHFLPKRYHWDVEDFQRLGYFWFNGPQGRSPPGSWKIGY